MEKRALTKRFAAMLMAPLMCVALGANAGDPDSGKELYDEVDIHATINGVEYKNANCETCHESSVYQPKERLSTMAKLEAMVERCNTNLDVGWFPEDVSDVSAYLNREYYKIEN